jgi:protection of telomeres protein 1
MRDGVVSLLTNASSEFHFLASSKIPATPPFGGLNLPWRSYPPGKRRSPTPSEVSYVIWANHRIKEIDLPSEHEYEERIIQTMKPYKNKFSLLKDIKSDCYYDVLGQVIRLYDASDRMTLYLSDYTTNSHFHEYVREAKGDNDEGRDGDVFGYSNKRKIEANEWPGPYGKMTIKLTLWDDHAHFVRNHDRRLRGLERGGVNKGEELVVENGIVGEWVLLKNVKIEYGKIAGVLEGKMRGDGGKINVSVVRDAEDEQWKNAVKRKAEWKKKEMAQEKKRKFDEEGLSKYNSKKRREEKRAAGFKKEAVAEAKKRERLNGNENSTYAAIQGTRIF